MYDKKGQSGLYDCSLGVNKVFFWRICSSCNGVGGFDILPSRLWATLGQVPCLRNCSNNTCDVDSLAGLSAAVRRSATKYAGKKMTG